MQNFNFLTKNLVAQHYRQPVCLLPVGRNRSQRIGGNLNDNDFVKHVELGIYLFYENGHHNSHTMQDLIVPNLEIFKCYYFS